MLGKGGHALGSEDRGGRGLDNGERGGTGPWPRRSRDQSPRRCSEPRLGLDELGHLSGDVNKTPQQTKR